MPDTRRALSALQTLLADNTAGDISAQDARDVLVSNHPENVSQTAAMASEPASGQVTGDLFLPNNGFYLERYSGSAWVPWGPLFPFTKPVDGDFAWINQDSAAVTTTNGGIVLSRAAYSAVTTCNVRKKTAPSTPYTITAWFLVNVAYGGVGYGGLCFRQSSDGKLALFGIGTDSANRGYTASRKMTDPTTYSADYSLQDQSGKAETGRLCCLRIADNGTNRICSVSADGVNFQAFHTIGRTDFLTADEVGFYINPYNRDTQMTLLSWAQA